MMRYKKICILRHRRRDSRFLADVRPVLRCAPADALLTLSLCKFVSNDMNAPFDCDY